MRVMRSGALADPSGRALALLGVTIMLLITGLLGMHALNGEPSHAAGGDRDASTASSTQLTGDVDGLGLSGSAAHCDDGCVTPAHRDIPEAPGHEGVAACVLALLAGLILLVPPTAALPSVLRAPLLPALADRLSALVPLREPDLTVLSISRT